MKYLSIAILIAIIPLSAFFTGCNDSLISSDADLIFPDSLVSFQKHVYPFLMLKCSYQGCHSSESPAGGRCMADYSCLIYDPQNAGLINPGDPDHSEFVQILENKIPHYPPFQSGYIKDSFIKGIRQWILEGAKNN